MTLRTDKELDEAWSNIKSDLEKELDRTVNMTEVQKLVIGETRFKKYLYTILKKLKIRLEDEGFDDTEIRNMFKAILYGYYAKSHGMGEIFEEDFERLGLNESSFFNLAQFNVANMGDEENKRYWVLTEEYIDAGKELALDKVKEKSHELENQLREIPDKILALFAFIQDPEQWQGHTNIANLSAWDKYVLPYPASDHHGFFGLKPFKSILSKDIFRRLDEIAKIVMELDLGIHLVNYYRGDSYIDYKLNMTRYYLVKREYFVTCPETVDEIKNILRKRIGIAEPSDILANELRKYKVYKFLEEWLPATLRGKISSDEFQRLLEMHNISFEELKEELREYEEKGQLVFKTLEDVPPLRFKGDLRESFGKIVESLEDSIITSFTSD